MAQVRKTIYSRKSSARKTARGKTSARRSTTRRPSKRAAPKRWSQRVTKESDALDLKRGVFKLTSARKIAASHSWSKRYPAWRAKLFFHKTI